MAMFVQSIHDILADSKTCDIFRRVTLFHCLSEMSTYVLDSISSGIKPLFGYYPLAVLKSY